MKPRASGWHGCPTIVTSSNPETRRRHEMNIGDMSAPSKLKKKREIHDGRRSQPRMSNVDSIARDGRRLSHGAVKAVRGGQGTVRHRLTTQHPSSVDFTKKDSPDASRSSGDRLPPEIYNSEKTS